VVVMMAAVVVVVVVVVVQAVREVAVACARLRSRVLELTLQREVGRVEVRQTACERKTRQEAIYNDTAKILTHTPATTRVLPRQGSGLRAAALSISIVALRRLDAGHPGFVWLGGRLGLGDGRRGGSERLSGHRGRSVRGRPGTRRLRSRGATRQVMVEKCSIRA
jgi:hypothetical protein